MRRMSAAALPAGARERPVPKSASTHTSGRSRLSTESSRTPASRARRRFSMASGLFGSSASTKATSAPRGLSRRAAARPSPPLPPGPQAKKMVRKSPKRSTSREASAEAACSITSMDATPDSGEIELFHFAHLFRGQNERAQCHAITSHISVQAAHGDVAGQHGLRFAVHLPDQRAVLAEVQRLALAAIYAYPLPQRRRAGADAFEDGDKAAFLPSGVPRLEAFKKYRKKFLGRDARAGLEIERSRVGKLLWENPFARG